MAKLPGINYNRTGGVSSLGREPVDAYGGIARADNAVLSAMVSGGLSIAEKIKRKNESNEAAGISSVLTEKMAELNARIKSTKTYTTDQLDDLGIEYKSEKGGVERDIIPASEVAEAVYKKSAAQLKANSLSGTSGKVGGIVNKVYGSLYKSGIGDAIGHALNFANTEAKIKANVGFENAVVKGNPSSAMSIAKVALANGTWSEKEYLAKTEPMMDRVTNQEYLRQLDLIDDNANLDLLRGDMLFNNDLSYESKKTLYKTMATAESRITSRDEKVLKKETTENSSALLTTMTADVLGTNIPMPWDLVPEETSRLIPSDRKAFIAINKALHGGSGTVSDSAALRELTIEVETLSMPKDETTVFQRKGDVVDKLISAVGDGKLSPKDFSILMGSVNSAQDFPYTNFDHKAVDDEIWITLTGGSKDIISQLFGGGEAKINVVDASNALNRAARTSGPSFDPHAWWTQNQDKYLVKAIKENRANLQKDIALGRIIMKDGRVDFDSTRKALQLKVKNNKISQDEMNRTLNQAKKRDDMDRDWDAKLKDGRIAR